MTGHASTSWMKRLGLVSGLLACAPAWAGTLTVMVAQRDGHPLAGAVVTVEPLDASSVPASPVRAVMDQVNLEFAPDVLVIPVKSTVLFPNSDAVSHQVYSFSEARQFKLPLYRGKPYPPMSFDQPGIVTLGCNIHDNMLAYIVVTAAPRFGRSDAHGEWSAGNLAAGRYRVRLWHPLLADDPAPLADVEVGDADSTAALRLQRNLHPAPVAGRPHSWDY